MKEKTRKTKEKQEDKDDDKEEEPKEKDKDLDNIEEDEEQQDKDKENTNIYINGNEKKKDIREIIHKEKKLIEGRISYLNGVIKGIKMRDPDINKNGDDQEDKNDTEENNFFV